MLICKSCGGETEKNGHVYICVYCDSRWEEPENDINQQQEEQWKRDIIEKILSDVQGIRQKQEEMRKEILLECEKESKIWHEIISRNLD